MTVKELRMCLDRMPDDMEVLVIEQGEGDPDTVAITPISSRVKPPVVVFKHPGNHQDHVFIYIDPRG